MSDDPTTGPDRPRRTVHGRRRGRPLNAGRAQLLTRQLDALSIRPDQLPVLGQPARLFPAPVERVWLEIGFGSGDHLAGQLRASEGVGMIGCEPYLNGVATALKHLIGDGGDDLAARVRLWADDARTILDALGTATIERTFILFPDPWPKQRHHKRRFVQPRTLDVLARVMVPGGRLRLATDDVGLARWMLEHTWHHPAFDWLARRANDWRQRPVDWIATRYEAKAIREGRPPFYFDFRRIGL